MKQFWAVLIVLLSFTAIWSTNGCVSARMSDRASDRLFREGQYKEAANKFREGVKEQGENGRDLLLYLLDLGLSLHSAGKYEESNNAFFRAEKIAEIYDYTSLAAESATLLVSENIKVYKGEDFEKVLINTYIAINYALMGKLEDALVEARRVNRKLHLMVTEGQRKYKQNAFARYLSAIIYEAENNYNDAYVDYKKTLELIPDYPGLGRDLWRMAWQLRMPDEMEKWDQKFELTKQDHKLATSLEQKRGKSEIIVIFENGISPVKRPHPSFSSIPKFFPRYNPVSYAEVVVDGETKASTSSLHDVESTAIENLDEKYAGIIAKKVAGIVAKEVVADQIGRRTDSPLLWFLTRVALYAGDQADLRSWNLLPRDLQIARIPVEPGVHTVKVKPVGFTELGEKTVEVAAGKKVFVNFRYIPYY